MPIQYMLNNEEIREFLKHQRTLNFLIIQNKIQKLMIWPDVIFKISPNSIFHQCTTALPVLY
jgi:hypothetical protein